MDLRLKTQLSYPWSNAFTFAPVGVDKSFFFPSGLIFVCFPFSVRYTSGRTKWELAAVSFVVGCPFEMLFEAVALFIEGNRTEMDGKIGQQDRTGRARLVPAFGGHCLWEVWTDILVLRKSQGRH